MNRQDAKDAKDAKNIKKELRALVHGRLKAMTSLERQQASREAVERLLTSREFHSARTVLAYDSSELEVDTRAVLEACLSGGKTLCLPRTRSSGRGMEAHRVADLTTDLETSRFGFREPKAGSPVVPAEQIDLIIVPGVAFDAAGNRLGRGAGYYDRFLAQPELRACLCALAFECQIARAVPTQPHDRKVQIIFTEKRKFRITP